MKIVHLCSTQDDSWSWLGGQTHRRGAYTRAVIERLGLIIRILSMVNSGFVPDGCIECCGESVQYLKSVKLFE